MLSKLNPEQRGNLALLLIGAFVFITFFSVSILGQIDLRLGTWKYPSTIPTMTPVGWDFRDGLYNPAGQIISRQPVAGIYPPLAYTLGLPFALTLTADQSYLVQIVLLALCNVAVILLSLQLASKFFFLTLDLFIKKYFLIGLLFLMLTYQFSSYGFVYSIERGNYDIYAIFFSLVGVWLLLNRPKSMIWQILCISIAAHLKIYPAILFLLLFWKHRFKMVLPALLINSLLIMILGPQIAFGFIKSLQSFSNSTSHYWAGNHSTASFLFCFGISEKSAAGIFLTIFPVTLWLVSTGFLLPGGYTEGKALWAFISSVPVMNVVPAISNDYKLVILIVPFSLMLAFLSMEFIQRGRLKPLILISVTMMLSFYISNSYVLLHPVLQNKWPFIVILQIVLLAAERMLFVRSGEQVLVVNEDKTTNSSSVALPTP